MLVVGCAVFASSFCAAASLAIALNKDGDIDKPAPPIEDAAIAAFANPNPSNTLNSKPTLFLPMFIIKAAHYV